MASLFAALESYDESAIDPHVTAPTTDGVTEVEPNDDVRGETLDGAQQEVKAAGDSIESENEAIAKAADAIDALESYAQLLTQSLENGGVDIYTHQAIRIGAEKLVEGIDFSSASLESIDTTSGKHTATLAALESLHAAQEGLLDTIKDKLKSIWKGLGALFDKFKDLFRTINGMAKDRKKKLQNSSTVMVGDEDKEAVVEFKDMSRLAKDGDINTLKIAKAFEKLKEDFTDAKGLASYWNRVAALVTDGPEDGKELEKAVNQEGLKLPSGLEDGDKFGLFDKVPEDSEAKTWSVTDTIGGALMVPKGENKLSLRMASTAKFTDKTIKSASAPDRVKPLTREQAIEICDIIISFTDAFSLLSSHFGAAESRLAKATQMVEANGVNVPAIEGFWGDSYQTWKEGNKKFKALYYFLGITAITLGSAVSYSTLMYAIPSLPFINSVTIMGVAFSTAILNQDNRKAATDVGIALGAIISYPIAMLITLARGSKGAPKDVQDDYEAYVAQYAKLTDEQKKHLPNPADVDAARKLVEDKGAQKAFNQAVVKMEMELLSASEAYFEGYSDFAFGIADQAFPIMLRHIDASIKA